MGQVLLFFLGFRQSTALYVQLLGFWGCCHPPTRNYIHEELEFLSSGEKQITCCNSSSLKKPLKIFSHLFTLVPKAFSLLGRLLHIWNALWLRVYHTNTHFMPSVRVLHVLFEWSLLKSALSPGLDPGNPRSVFNSTFVEPFR